MATFDMNHGADIAMNLREKQGGDKITVLTSVGLRMAKRWNADGTIDPYGNAKNFHHREVEIDDIHALSALLTRIEHNPFTVIVRGGYIGKALAEPVMSKVENWKPGCMVRQLEVIKDRAIRMMMIDVDEFRPTTGDPITQPVACIEEFITDSLPDCFAGASYHWQLSNSAGSAKNAGLLKVHIWFWLDTPYTCAELSAWQIASRIPIDPSVFRVIQPHYTAAPVLAPGVANPVPVRSGFVNGWMGDSVSLIITHDVLRPAAPAQKEETRNAVTNDPVAQRLYDRGMVRNEFSRGGLNIVCPREIEHTSSDGKTGPTSCLYYPAYTGGYKSGTFKCQHAHCADVPQHVFTEALGISAAEGFKDVGADPLAQSDVEIARRAAEMMAGRFVYEHGARGWMHYLGGVYLPCARGEEVEIVKRLGVEILKTSQMLTTDDVKRTAALAQRVMSAAGVKAALQLAQSDPRLAVQPADFDADPDLLNVQNGVIYLPSGELRQHDHAQFFSRQCPYHYDPEARAPTWARFLQQISNDDPDWVDFMQRAVGYSLSGHVNEEIMFFLLGIGANGKSVFCNVMRHLGGGYVGAVPANFLMVSKRDGESATPSLAALVGARVVQANEVEAGARLSAQMVKVATSTDAISARHLYGRQFTFTPTHTLWVRGNHKPIITDNDEGIWRRLVLIPFDRHFTAEEKDTGLEAAIMREAPGVLAWMVRGHLEYRQRGLRRAARVAAASHAYRIESDLVGQWIDEQATRGPGCVWQQRDAYLDYSEWCTGQGLHPMAKKSLTTSLKERGFNEGQETTGGRLRIYRGLKSVFSCGFDAEPLTTAAQDAQD
ncbi:MAG: DNA primase family protein [Burkholderiaceae bacterium]